MKVTHARGGYKRAVSDGNYGTESAEVAYDADLDEGEDAIVAAQNLQGMAKAVVVDRLADSLNSRVRAAVTPPVHADLEDLPL